MDIGLKKKFKEGLTIEEAIQNLMTISEMSVDEKTPLGILKEKRITTDKEDFYYKEIEWLFPEDPIGFIENIKPSYITLTRYLEYITKKEDIDWEDQSFIDTIENMVEIAEDAMSKINEYFALYHKKIEFHKSEEYQNFQRFYIENILPKIPKREDKWKTDAEKDKNLETLELDQSGIKNFDSILKDQEYELFQMKDYMDRPIFTHDLLRDIKIFGKFDDEFGKKDDFLIQIENLRSKDMQVSAYQILELLKEDMKKFYKARFDFKKNRLASCINKAFMALMLAANFKNIKKIKSSFAYFKDFQIFLREIFSKEKSDEKSFFVYIINKICFSLFQTLGGIKEEIIGFIYRMMKSDKEEGTFWNEIERKDVILRKFLKRYPNGALRKLLKILELEDEKILGFDPIFEGNMPCRLYDMKYKSKTISFHHIPSPTKQENLKKAFIIPEFLGFLEIEEKHLLFNFQDRNSLRENARANAIEELQNMVEFKDKLKVVSLDKHSNFYYQTKLYSKISLFEAFKKELKHQIFSNIFFFPKEMIREELIENIISFTHKYFFLEKKELSHQERLDFIEIFYHVLILKIIDIEKPSSISFVCKDGIDIGATFEASFFSFLKFSSKEELTKKDKDFILWLIYSKALMIRERAVDQERLIRTLSAVSRMDNNKKNLQEHFLEVFSFPFRLSDNFSL